MYFGRLCNLNINFDVGRRVLSSEPESLKGFLEKRCFFILVNPDGQIGIVGGVTGAISGGIGGAISGGASGVVVVAIAGGLVGAVNPAASGAVGAAFGSAAASGIGQALGNALTGKDPTDIGNYNLPAIVGAGLAGPLGNGLGKFVPPYRPPILGRPLTSFRINRWPQHVGGAITEGTIVGSGELIGSNFK